VTQQRETQLHHVVFAVAPERQAAVAQMFTELGFRFDSTELTELGLKIHLDWNGGVELISAVPGATADVAASVRDFVECNGDGIYTVVLRVPGASAAEAVVERYGSRTPAAGLSAVPSGPAKGADRIGTHWPRGTFGDGVHYCLGANLARRELAEALKILAQRLPNPRRAGPAPWKPLLGMSGPTSLPMEFG
jgi:methylmalonyl-CoA/ethylmalonyl-CoA epimerase